MKTVKMLAILTLAMCASAAAANAQSVTGRFTLPYEVHWGAATLPAGEYMITMDSLHSASLVQSAGNSQSFLYMHADDERQYETPHEPGHHVFPRRAQGSIPELASVWQVRHLRTAHQG